MSNTNRTKARRETTKTMPTTLPLGELMFCTDTNELYVGRGSNTPINKVIDPEVIQKQKELTSQLDSKANKNEVGAPLSVSSISQMLDKTKVYVNTTDGNWYSWDGSVWKIGGTYQSAGIGLKTVTWEKTDFIEPGKNATFEPKNVFNVANVSAKGDWCNPDDGSIVNTGGTQAYRNTGYIAIDKAEQYLFNSKIQQICFFTSSKTFISSNSTPQTGSDVTINGKTGKLLSIPNNCSYIIANILDFQYNLTEIWQVTSTVASVFTIPKLDLNKSAVKSVNNITPDEFGNVNLTTGVYEGNIKDKVIIHFGDSICQGAKYPQIIATRTGAITKNCGIGGTTMAHYDLDYGYVSFYDLTQAIKTGDWTSINAVQDRLVIKDKIDLIKSIDFTKVDMITIAYGTNDFGGNLNIGKIDDTTISRNYMQSLIKGVETLLSINKKLKVYILTPIYRDSVMPSGGNSDDNDNGYSKFLYQYGEACIEASKKRLHCPVLDLYNNSGINRYNASLMLADKLHPTNLGYEIIGHKVCNFILSN